MDTTALPGNPGAFAGAGWDRIRPHYDDLARAPLDHATAPGWLRAWSHLEELLTEAANRAYIAHTADTRDAARAEEERRFAADVWPRAEAERVRLSARLLDLGYAPPGLATTLRRFANRRALFREENAAPLAALATLDGHYQGLIGALTVDWDGTALTRAQVRPFALAPDRATRERAFRAQAAPLVARRDAFEDLFDRQLALRQTIARNAGFRDYRDYAHREKGRFDYTPDDCVRFHEAVAAAVVPAVRRRLERRRRLLGLGALRPWDTAHDPLGRPPLAPFAAAAGLIGPAEAILARLDPALGAQVGMLREEGLLDLASRPGKAPGGYSIALPWRKRPFVFMNAAGTARDVEVLLHELGHAAHSLARFAAQPLFWQRDPGLEMNELAALALELLAAPHLDREAGGYYAPAEARRARAEQLDTVLTSAAAIRPARRLAAVGLHQPRRRRPGRARRRLASPERALPARGGLGRAGGGAGGAAARVLPTVSRSVLPDRVRVRAGRGAAALAHEPGGPGRDGGALPRRAGPRRDAAAAGPVRGRGRAVRHRYPDAR